MKIYISLPISGCDANKQREHADSVKVFLSHMGHRPISPFDIFHGKNPTYVDYICTDLRTLAGCEAVIFCEGWENSMGCLMERCLAKKMGKTIFYSGEAVSGGDNSKAYSPDEIKRIAEKYAEEHPMGNRAEMFIVLVGFVSKLLDTHLLVRKKGEILPGNEQEA